MEDENDFQKSLRKEIIAIQSDNKLTPQEKAKLIQALMTTRLHSSYGGQTQDTGQNLGGCEEQSHSPSYFNVEQKILGCTHYRKNCKIKAECCQKFFTCRRCHDEQIHDHKINRYEIQTMICMLCQTTQPVSQMCTHCNTSMAHYYCGTCKFFDNDPNKNIWHCDKCGLCRIGNGRYKHCDICHMCIPADFEHTKHIERAYEANCPICGEWMQNSTLVSIQPMPCKHAIHNRCYKEYCKQHYACPICSHTYADFNPLNWIFLRQTINELPMPPEYNDWRVEILCNDCNIKTECPYHFLGHACQKCAGYNTKITKTMRPEADQQPTQEDTLGSPGDS